MKDNRFKFGDKIRAYYELKRMGDTKMDENCHHTYCKLWKALKLKEPLDGFFIGYRTLSNGTITYNWGDEPTEYKPKLYFQACQVALSHPYSGRVIYTLPRLVVGFTEETSVISYDVDGGVYYFGLDVSNRTVDWKSFPFILDVELQVKDYRVVFKAGQGIMAPEEKYG